MPARVRVIFVDSVPGMKTFGAYLCVKWNHHGERRRREHARRRSAGRREARAPLESGGGLWQPRDALRRRRGPHRRGLLVLAVLDRVAVLRRLRRLLPLPLEPDALGG